MKLRTAIRDFPASYFALVMATGIVAIAAGQQGFSVTARILLAFSVIAYVVLWLFTLARLSIAPRSVFADLRTHIKGAGFFTIPAATFVLGSDLIVLSGMADVALGVWIFGVILWLVLTYAFFYFAAIEDRKPALGKGIAGVTLVTIVATQGVAVLAVHLAAAGIDPRVLMQTGLFFFVLGTCLYSFIMAMLIQRLLFEPLVADDLNPPYWVSMGVEAISALAGGLLLRHAAVSPLIAGLRPAIMLLTLAFWAMACWWIPLLLLLGFWRYVIKAVPLSYAASYWSMVFPLGMFTAATFVLGGLADLSWMHLISSWFIYIALTAWVLTAVGGAAQVFGIMMKSSSNTGKI